MEEKDLQKIVKGIKILNEVPDLFEKERRYKKAVAEMDRYLSMTAEEILEQPGEPQRFHELEDEILLLQLWTINRGLD